LCPFLVMFRFGVQTVSSTAKKVFQAMCTKRERTNQGWPKQIELFFD
jgi:hypothetical protein